MFVEIKKKKKVFLIFFFLPIEVTYTLYANTMGRTLGLWLATITFDVNVLQFISLEVAPIWNDANLFSDLVTINSVGVLDIWTNTESLNETLLMGDQIELVTLTFSSKGSGILRNIISVIAKAMSDIMLVDYGEINIPGTFFF